MQAAFAVSKLFGRARLTCGSSVNIAFPTWDTLKHQLSRVFAPPNEVYRVRSRFLAARQGKRELQEFIQELRTLIAAMGDNPVSEEVSVTIFMEGLRNGIARMKVLRIHPSTFEEAVHIALNAEYNFKSARLGWNGYNPNSSSSSGPYNVP